LLLKGRHNAAAGWLNHMQAVVCAHEHSLILPDISYYPAQLSSQQGLLLPRVNNALPVLCILSRQPHKQHLQPYYALTMQLERCMTRLDSRHCWKLTAKTVPSERALLKTARA